MQRKLNLNEPSGKILAAVGAFLFVIPFTLFVVLLLFEYNNIAVPVIPLLIKLSFGFGLLLAVTFGILVVAEQIQDRRYHQTYQEQKKHKIDSGDGRHECQYCGNREVSASDRSCRVCGNNLQAPAKPQ